MSEIGKRLLAVILAVILCCSSLTALAADEGIIEWQGNPYTQEPSRSVRCLGDWNLGEEIEMSAFKADTCYRFTAEKAGVYSFVRSYPNNGTYGFNIFISDHLENSSPYGYKTPDYYQMDGKFVKLFSMEAGETVYISGNLYKMMPMILLLEDASEEKQPTEKPIISIAYCGQITELHRTNDKILTSASFSDRRDRKTVSDPENTDCILDCDFTISFDNGSHAELFQLLYTSVPDFSEMGYVHYNTTVLGKDFSMREVCWHLSDIVKSVEVFDDNGEPVRGVTLFDGTRTFMTADGSAFTSVRDNGTLRFRFDPRITDEAAECSYTDYEVITDTFETFDLNKSVTDSGIYLESDFGDPILLLENRPVSFAFDLAYLGNNTLRAYKSVHLSPTRFLTATTEVIRLVLDFIGYYILDFFGIQIVDA